MDEKAIEKQNEKDSPKDAKKEDISLSTIDIQENKKKEKLIDKIIENGCQTKFPIFMTMSIIYGFIADGVVNNIFNLIILPIRDYFNTSELLLEIMAGSLFIGVALGSAIASSISMKYGRGSPIKICYGLMFVFHIIIPIYMNVPVFIISRVFMGICLGIIEPLIFNAFGEYLPSKIRGLFLMSSWFFCTFAVLIQNLIALFIMPHLEKEKLQKYLFIMSIPSFIAFVVNLIMMNDSPRFLLVNANYINNEAHKKIKRNKAFKILSNMYKIQLTDRQKKQIINETKISNINANAEKPKVCELFYLKYLRTTLIGIFVFFVFACGYYGFYIISTLTLEKLNKEKKYGIKTDDDKNNRNGIIKNQIYIALFDLLGSVIGGLLAEVKFIGRKGVMWIFMLLSAFTIIPSIYSVTYFNIFFTLSISFSAIYGDMIVTYFAEIFPTKLRDLSSSFFLTSHRLSGFISQFLFLGLFKIDYKFPYYFGSFLSLIGVFTIFLLPYDAIGKPLDFELAEEKKGNDLNYSIDINPNVEKI